MSDAKTMIARATNDPAWFCANVLGEDLWSKQRDILNAVRDHRRVTVRSCHGVGKTRTAANVALWFLFTHPESKVITTAPTWHQVQNLLWREIAGVHAAAKIPLGGQPITTRLDLGAQWFAIGLSTNKPERFQGFHAASGHILLICDEASGIEQSIFDAAEGFLTSEGSRLLLIGNPTQLSGEFYSSFRSPLYHKIHISAFDSPNLIAGKVLRPYLITPEWVDEKRVKWGEDNPLWYARVLGEFPEQGEDTLVPLAWIERAQARHSETQRTGQPVLGVDVARFGTDASVIVAKYGVRYEIIHTLRKHATTDVAGAVGHYYRDLDARQANVDVCGIGAGVADMLREQRYNVVDMNAGESPRDKERFVNARAEWYWGLREAFQNDEISIPNDEQLSAELAALKYGFDSRGRIKIESKDDMKKRGLSSPDMADALMLACSNARTYSPIIAL